MNLKGSPMACSINTNPSPLEDGFDFPVLPQTGWAEATKAMSAKAFLATEQRIVGLETECSRTSCGLPRYIPGTLWRHYLTPSSDACSTR